MNHRFARKLLLTTVLFLGTLCAVFAQTTLDTGPASLKWKHFKNNSVDVIYPSGADSLARHVSSTLDHVQGSVSRGLGIIPTRLPLILQNQTMVSNGFVSMGPRRTEFFTNTTQDYNFLGTINWLDLLAVHEYRHVVQNEVARTGTGSVIEVLAGTLAARGAAGLMAHSWFWEGDAVVAETSLTRGGRGRYPAFNRAFRMNLLERGGFNYEKQIGTSFKDFVPNHYVTGYHMVAYVRRKTDDPLVWGKISRRTFNRPFIPFAFSSSIKKYSGSGVRATYGEMLADLRQQWEAQLAKIELTNFSDFTPRKNKVYTDYSAPEILPSGDLLVVRTGLSHADQLLKISPDGEVRLLRTLGRFNNPGYISVAQNKMVWAEFESDPRWPMRVYSVLKTMDLSTLKVEKLTQKSRLMAPAFSPDGSRIVAVRSTETGNYRLVVLDGFSGAVRNTFSIDGAWNLLTPRWFEDGMNVVFVTTKKEGKYLVKLNVNSGAQTTLLGPTMENFGVPRPQGKYVLYNSPKSGIDNIYALDTASGKTFQLTSSKYGAYNGVLSDDLKTLYYNDFGKCGMNVVSAAADPQQWRKGKNVQDTGIHYFQPLVEQEKEADLLANVPKQSVEEKPYHKAAHLVRPYQWGLTTTSNLSLDNFMLGFVSQSNLSNFSLNAGAVYDLTEKAIKYQGGFSWQGWYPVLSFNASYGGRKLNRNRRVNGVVVETMTEWDETNLSTKISLPLDLTRSRFFQFLNLGVAMDQTFVDNYEHRENNQITTPVFREQRRGWLNSLNTTLSYSYLFKQAKRDIYSRWGFTAYGQWQTSISGNMEGEIYGGLLRAFLPGVWRHHSLRLKAGAQHQFLNTTDNLHTYNSTIGWVRGASYFTMENYALFGADYALPFWYPDIHIGPLVNVQRIRLNMFFDYGYSKGPLFVNRNNQLVIDSNFSLDQKSVGTEVMFDFNGLRTLPLISAGFRYAYAFEEGNSVSLLLSF